MSRISVVVPIYHVETYLAECLESLLAQTVRDLEVVMVDDGSTDGSAAVAERYTARDPRLRLVRQANRGLGPRRNNRLDTTRLRVAHAATLLRPSRVPRAGGGPEAEVAAVRPVLR